MVHNKQTQHVQLDEKMTEYESLHAHRQYFLSPVVRGMVAMAGPVRESWFPCSLTLRAETRTLCHPPSWRLATKNIDSANALISEYTPHPVIASISEAIQFIAGEYWIASLTARNDDRFTFEYKSICRVNIFVARRQLGGWQRVRFPRAAQRAREPDSLTGPAIATIPRTTGDKNIDGVGVGSHIQPFFRVRGRI